MISALKMFVSSHPNGTLSLTHLKEKWETFLTISEETLDLLKYMQKLSKREGKEFSIESFSIHYGGNRFLIEHNKYSSIKDNVITLIDYNFSVVEIEKINPVIYFCAFSSHEILKSSILSIRSYEMFSNVSFTYVLFTNVHEFDFPTDIENLKVIYVESVGTISHLYKRYSQEVMSHLLPYSPIFYSDCDILCNNDLQELVKEVMASETIYVNSEPDRETDFIMSSGWFISDFYQFDETIREKTIYPVNSGFFAFKSVKCFQFVSTNLDRLSLIINTRHGGSHYAFDQSAFNYILTKFCIFDTEFLIKYIINWPPEEFSQIKRSGIIHFCGGVGHFSSKYERMAAYLDYISTDKIPDQKELPASISHNLLCKPS